MIKITANNTPIGLDIFSFPGGEQHVRLDPAQLDQLKQAQTVSLEAHLQTSTDIMALLLVTDAIKRCAPSAAIRLICPYVPYARQDRVALAGEALSIRVFADLINAQGYDEVEIWDPHSNVTAALLDRVCIVHACEFVQQIDLNDCVVLAPDHGAAKRAYACAQTLHAPFAIAQKHRDVQTGDITHTSVSDSLPQSANVLIVDDICDGGRTFIELAKVLKNQTSGRIHLYVTHGIFSKGFRVFEGLIDTIYVANSWSDTLPGHVKRLSRLAQA